MCLFVLRFYGPVNPMGSCRVRSVYLTTHLLGRLSPLSVNQHCAHSSARNWQLPFLNQREGENDRRKYFMINLHERMLPTLAGVELTTSCRMAHPTEPPRPQFFVMSQLYIHENLVIIQLLFQKILCRQESVTEFSVFLLLWSWN